MHTGDDALSKLVNVAINIRPLYAVMKVMAKKTLKDTAEQRGVPWDGTIRELTGQLEVALDSVAADSIAVRQDVKPLVQLSSMRA